MKRFLKILSVISATLAISCIKQEIPEPGKSIEIKLQINGENTKSSMKDDAINQIKTVNIAFYSGGNLLFSEKSNNTSSGTLTITNVPGSNCNIYALANCNSTNWSWPSAESSLASQTVSNFSVTEINTNGVPMAAKSSWATGQASVILSLDRLVSRYNVTAKGNYTVGTWALTSLKVVNPAATVKPFSSNSSATSYLLDNDIATTVDITSLNNNNTVQIYAPENVGGQTKIEIEGIWDTGDGCKSEEKYTISTASNNIRNTEYNLSLKANKNSTNWEFSQGKITDGRIVVFQEPYTRLVSKALTEVYNTYEQCDFNTYVNGVLDNNLKYKIKLKFNEDKYKGKVKIQFSFSNGTNINWTTLNDDTEWTVQGSGRFLIQNEYDVLETLQFSDYLSKDDHSIEKKAIQITCESLTDSKIIGQHNFREYNRKKGPFIKLITAIRMKLTTEDNEAFDLFSTQGDGMYFNGTGKWVEGENGTTPQDHQDYLSGNILAEYAGWGYYQNGLDLTVYSPATFSLTMRPCATKNGTYHNEDFLCDFYLNNVAIKNNVRFTDEYQYIGNKYTLEHPIYTNLDIYDAIWDCESMDFIVKYKYDPIPESEPDPTPDPGTDPEPPAVYPYVERIDLRLSYEDSRILGAWIIGGGASAYLTNSTSKEVIYYNDRLDNYTTSGTVIRNSDFTDEKTYTVSATINGNSIGKTTITFQEGETQASFAIYQPMTQENLTWATDPTIFSVTIE